MGDVVKQLVFSPISNSPNFPSSHLFQSPDNFGLPVKRLDESLSSSWAVPPAAATGLLPAHQTAPAQRKAATFRVPSDDEDEDNWYEAPASEQQGLGRSPYAHTRAGPAAGPNQQQQQQQQLSTYSFSASTYMQPTSSRANSLHPASARHPVQTVLEAHTKQLQADALLAAEKQQWRLHQQIQSVEQELAAQLQEVQQQLAHKRARAAAADEESRRQRTAERSRRLAEVQRQQQELEQAQASALQEVKRAQQEAARKQAEAEAKLRQQQEQERKKKEAEAAAAAAAKAAEEAKAKEEEAKRAQEQQQQQQQQQAAAAAAAPPAAASSKSSAIASSSSDPHLKATAAALEYEKLLQQKLKEAEAAAAELTSKPELKQQRRALEKQITMAVSQISGTQQQVQAKSKQLVEVLCSCSTPQQQALAYVTLANRIVSQCDGQVQKIGSFAFPLAYVCVAVGAAVPAFMELLLAKLQVACPLLVPKYTMYSTGTSKEDWYKALGYKEIEDPKTGVLRRENADEFVARMSAMVLLYGAIVQTEAAGNPAGMAHGWSWLARCLNALPPTRPSAAALMSFLAHAGYRMAAVYGRQFRKLMQHIAQHYLPALEEKAAKDADLRAVGTRLQLYVNSQQYMKEPEGRTLKKVDESSYTRA